MTVLGIIAFVDSDSTNHSNIEEAQLLTILFYLY